MTTDDDDNLITFPGLITREEAQTIMAPKYPRGAVVGINDEDFDITIYGSPTRAELLWLAKQLEMKAMFR